MNDADEPYKVYVSRIPLHWTEGLLYEHFVTLAFGNVKRVELFTSRNRSKDIKKARKRSVEPIKYCYTFKNHGSCDNPNCQYAPCNGINLEEDRSRVDRESTSTCVDLIGEENSLGSGIVVFEKEEGMQNALDQKSMHVARRSIHISPYLDHNLRESMICYGWTQFRCKHGDLCKFVHEGPGSVEKHSKPYQGRAFQCLSYRTKGKCSKGDACQFLHIKQDNSRKRKMQVEGRSVDGSTAIKGVCKMLKRKGKCRKGDRCPYSHDLVSERKPKSNDASDFNSKKRKINGKYLVEKRAEIKATFDG